MFELHYQNWLKQQEASRKGESLRRLKEGHGHAEKVFVQQVWWPAVGSLEHLYPEYEAADFRDGKRYLDYAYLKPPHRICMEIDGFGPHARDMNRWQFADQLNRQNHLQLDGWKILRFSFDEIKDKPRHCQQIIQQMMGRWYNTEIRRLPLRQREIVRQALEREQPFGIKEVCAWLEMGQDYARSVLREMTQAEMLRPVSGSQRKTRYILTIKDQWI